MEGLSYAHNAKGWAMKPPNAVNQRARLLKSITVPVEDLIQWIGDCNCSKVKKGVLLYVVLATYYHTWKQRNKARVEGCVLKPELVSAIIKREVKLKPSTRDCLGLDRRDKEWLTSIKINL